jgi:pilus assembly protein CpaE
VIAMTPTILLTGDWSSHSALHGALAAREDVRLGTAQGDVVVHVTAGVETLRDELATVREHAHAPVVVLASRTEAGLLEAALALDVAEVLIAPQTPDAVVFAVQKVATAAAGKPRPSGRQRVITVFSPKGGTGKSVVACNLALALAESGARTLLVDLDLQFGDVAIMLGLQPERTLHDLLTAPGSLDAEKIAGYATRYGPQLDVLPAPIKPEDAESIADARVGDLLDAARGGWDAIVVDTAPFFHGAVLATLDRTDDLVMVCAPDVPTMKNVRLTLQTLELLSFPTDRVRLLLNRANARIGFRAAQVATVLDREVDLELPEDESVTIGVNRGTPAVAMKPGAPFAVAIRNIAARLSEGAGASRTTARSRRFAFGRKA